MVKSTIAPPRQSRNLTRIITGEGSAACSLTTNGKTHERPLDYSPEHSPST